MGEVLQVGPAGVVEFEDASQSVEYRVGGFEVAALLESGVVVGADPGELGDLLTTKPGDATERGVGQPSFPALDVSLDPQTLAELDNLFPGPGEAPDAYTWS